MSEAEFLWTVDQYSDSVRKRRASEANRYLHGNPFYKHVFLSEELANEFVIQRARNGIAAAKDDLKSAERRLKKCEKKFGNPL